MAFYFLEKSPTYMRTANKEIIRRRQIVCKYLNNNYRISRFKDKESYDKIVSELTKENIRITKAQYQGDKVILRISYLWLMSDPDNKAKITAKKIFLARRSINCLVEDNLYSWLALDFKKELLPAPALLEQGVAEPIESLASKTTGVKAAQGVIDSINSLVADLEIILEENERLKTEAKQLSEEAARLRFKIDDYEEYVKLVEDENTALTDKIGAMRDAVRFPHSSTLREIAGQYSEYPELSIIAQKIESAPGRRHEILNKIDSRLPKNFTWSNDRGSMVYERHFLNALLELTPAEQDQVVKQIKILSEQGMEYASLHTRKNEMRLPFSPPGCQTSRGSDSIRFTWKKNSDIAIYWLYRKGDACVRQSES